MIKRICLVLLPVALLSVFAGLAVARSLEVEPSAVSVIRPTGESDTLRLLVRFSMPEVLSGYSADFACVSFEADCSGDREAVSFQAFAITKAWDEKTVRWTGTWDAPGGDWDKSLSSYSVAEVGTGEMLEFDITDFVNRWLKEPSGNFGVIVKVSGPFLGTFAVDGAVKPKLRILY